MYRIQISGYTVQKQSGNSWYKYGTHVTPRLPAVFGAGCFR